MKINFFSKVFINRYFSIPLKNFVVNYGFSYFFSTLSYSQEGEDIVVKRYFDGRKEGFYVEVGCHHPFRFSNTFLFYKRGWSGICIDPLPGVYELFKKKRPRDICLEFGVSSFPSNLNYFMFNEPALNTFDKYLASKRDGLSGYHIVDIKQVKTLPLSDVLDAYIVEGGVIDLFSIDVEGLDLEVLKSNNWDKYRPEIIISESLEKNFSKLSDDPLVIYLESQGYSVYAKTGNSVILKDNLIKYKQ